MKKQNNKFPLLEKLKELVEIDSSVFANEHNPAIYRKRALALRKLGFNDLAIRDNTYSALLEKRKDIECYNHNYKPILNEEKFIKKYKDEKGTSYYGAILDIIKNDKYPLKNTEISDFYNRSSILYILGLFNLVLDDYNIVIRTFEQNYQQGYLAKYSAFCTFKGMLLALLGDYKQGLKLYEQRWNIQQEPFKNSITYTQKQWKGEILNKEDVLLIDAEQGLGDNIQFLRYAIYLKQQGVNIIVRNFLSLRDFLTYNLEKHGISTLPYKTTTENINATHWVKMGSLPYLCNTTINNIPITSKYLQSSEPYLQRWKNKLPLNSKPNIGIVWKGGEKIGSNSNKTRNISLQSFSKLFDINANFICLQKDITEDETSFLSQYNNVYDYHNELDSFFDTSAIIEQLDLVISVDTAVAHLAGAMGKPIWLLIPYAPDFRWGLNTDESIWYDSMQLFRQNLDYDWKPVIKRVFDKLNLIF